MKRLAALILIAAVTVGYSVPTFAQPRNSATAQARASRKAEKKQEKAARKYYKAQRKAERKMLKKDRKHSKYPTHPI